MQRDEMHMLISGYCAALIQPIEHGYDKADAERYLKTIIDFFHAGLAGDHRSVNTVCKRGRGSPFVKKNS